MLAVRAEHFMQQICSDFKGRAWYTGEAEEKMKQKKWVIHLQHNSVVTKQ